MTNAGQPAIATDGPVGIGGWLILPIIGLMVTPLRGVFHIASYAELFQSRQLLTDGQFAFIALEFLGNLVILLVLPIILLVLLFRKSASFARVFVAWAAGGLAFIVLDVIAAKILFGDVLAANNQTLLDVETIGELARSAITAAVWIPYMRLSRRVTNTFVN